jgi:proteasome lid subunit RPN8/RPN11
MHVFDGGQYRRLLSEAREASRQRVGAEICGLIIDTGSHLTLVRIRNVSRRVGSFVLSRPDVRRVVSAARVLGQQVVGTFHSHPVALAEPGASDIEHAVDDSLMFIFDCTGRRGRLWRIRDRKARELRYGFSKRHRDT